MVGEDRPRDIPLEVCVHSAARGWCRAKVGRDVVFGFAFPNCVLDQQVPGYRSRSCADS